MPVSQYFNNYSNQFEQDLVESLVVESIKIYGQDVFYCPRQINDLDPLYLADDVSSYNSQYFFEVYIKNVDNFGGDGRFLSKFNIEIRDEITFCLTFRTFYEEVESVSGQPRPNEGDIIFLPLNNKVYIVKYVQHEEIFYQLGALKLYALVCESFEYSDQQLNTGVPQIDTLQAQYSTGMSNYGILTENLQPQRLQTQDGYDLIQEGYILEDQTNPTENQYLQTQAGEIIDFTVLNPFGEESLEP